MSALWQSLLEIFGLGDPGMRTVFTGTVVYGLCAGLVGTFMLLRKRALVGDVVGHASLPGIALAFIVLELTRPGSGRSMAALLTGALAAGLTGVLCLTAVVRFTRIREDAALAIVLSIFFGLGIALFTIVQDLPGGNAAGLEGFIYGDAAFTTAGDVELIVQGAFAAIVICGLLFKEFTLLCFDEEYAASRGWPTGLLDLVLMGLVVGVTVIGLQTVGLLLVVAMLILPAAAARFWTEHIGAMALISAALGGAAAYLGARASLAIERFPAGPAIVLHGAAIFAVSLLFGARRGVARRAFTHWRLRRRVGRYDLMRSFYECLERRLPAVGRRELREQIVSLTELQAVRSWERRRVERLLAAAHRQGLVQSTGDGPHPAWRLTAEGAEAAWRATRNHRLWELYLINYADVAPSHVDRDADAIEHVLGPDLVEELQQQLTEDYPALTMPESPHPVGE